MRTFFFALFLLFFTLRPVLAQGPIRISYNSDWPPYSYGVGKDVKGLLPDLMEFLFTKHLGIKVIHGGAPWVRAQKVVKSGKFDAMVTYPSKVRLTYAHTSNNAVYNLTQRPVVAKGSKTETSLNKDPSIANIAKYRVCSIMGDGWSTAFYKKHNIPFYTAKDTQACLRLVANGRLDVFLDIHATVIHNMHLSKTTDKLSYLKATIANLPFTFLLSKQSSFGPELLTHFDKMLTSLKNDGTYEDFLTILNNKTYVVK